MTPEERTKLLDSLLDNEINEADFLRLEAELAVDPEVRQQYYQRLKLELLLERQAKEEGVLQFEGASIGMAPSLTGGKKISRSMMFAAGILALAATLVTVAFLVPDRELGPGDNVGIKTGDPQSEVESTALGFALLGGQSDAVWEGVQIGNNELVPTGELHLKSGMAHLELFSGVQMVIQGDAIFSVDSAMEVSLKHGRASASVPDAAHGFRVKTNQGDVVDLGTEFALDVSEERARVDVVAGEVELYPNGADAKRLVEGQSLELSNDGRTVEADKVGMMSPDAFKRQLSTKKSDQYEKWLMHSKAMCSDERLVAYYRMDSAELSSRKIPNLINDGETKSDGAIVACERTKNRWGYSDGALDFSRMGSRVRVNVPGEYRGITLLCWVKIDSLDREYNSLFLTDGHELNEPHWQIMADGRLFFSVKKYDNQKTESGKDRVAKHDAFSPVVWDSSLSGTWVMLASVYDVDAKRVTHFVNGVAVSNESVPDELVVEKVKIGPASIANWSEPMYRTDPKFVVRNLNGCIDEFALFKGALSAEEIAKHFQVGSPD